MKKSIGPRAAFAVAVAWGLMGCMPLFAQSAPSLSEEFRATAEGVRLRLDASDHAGAGVAARALLATARTPLETYTAAAMLMQASARVMDLKGEKLAIDGLRRSGLVPADRLVQLDGVLGLAHLGLGENRDAATVLARAVAAGAKDGKVMLGLAEALARTGDLAGSLAAARDALTLATAQGRTVPASWYDRGIALAAQHGDAAAQAGWIAQKLSRHGSPANWRSGLMGFLPRLGADQEATLDLYRLMAMTGALATERDWTAYAAAAERAGALREAVSALQAGLAHGALRASDPLIGRQIASLMAQASRAQAGTAARHASALRAGDEMLAAGQPARAAELYRAALARGDVANDFARLRLGIALGRSGDLAGARSAWSAIAGGSAGALARFWLVWVERAGQPVPPA